MAGCKSENMGSCSSRHLLACCLGLAILFGKNDDPTASMAAYLLTGAFLVSIAFTAAETNEKPNLIYTIIALAPIH